MITEIRLNNARVFERDERFPLSRLTILCGTNSAGKSTVLKSLLLLRQNMRSRQGLSAGNIKLRFTGQDLDLGNFRSFVSHGQVDRELQIGISVSAIMSSNSIEDLDPSITKEIAQDDLLGEGYVRYILHANFRFGITRQSILLPISDVAEKTNPDEGEQDEPPPSQDEAILRSASFELVSASGLNLLAISLVQDTTRLEGPHYLLEISRSLIGFPDSATNLFDETGNGKAIFQTVLRGILPDRLSGRVRTSSETSEKFANRPYPLPNILEEAFDDLRRSMNNIGYLGPLRAPAKRYYTGQPDYNVAADATGEFLPYLIRDRLNSMVYYASPTDGSTVQSTLGQALDYWLFYLRTGTLQGPVGYFRREIKVDTKQDVLIEMSLRSLGGSESYAVLDSGFGYSQVLPILARGLLLSQGATLIIEQPEVHLNPALQIRLTEFLLSLVKANKQVLIETHSEHIVNFVRAAIAEDESNKISEDCMVLYMDNVQGRPAVHDLCVTPDGTIPDLPSSFFGESAAVSARILRAQRKHRMLERDK